MGYNPIGIDRLGLRIWISNSFSFDGSFKNIILKPSSQSLNLFLSGDTFIGSDVFAILRFGAV